MATRPSNIGIKGIEIYFPAQVSIQAYAYALPPQLLTLWLVR